MRAARVQRVLVAGVAGGVGTTTVAALLWGGFGRLSAPELRDHAGGELGARLSGGDEVTEVDRTIVVHDVGPHAALGVDQLSEAGTLLVAVVSLTPVGLEAADALLAEVRERFGPNGLSRTLVVAAGTQGPHRLRRTVEEIKDRHGQRSLLVVPRDPALAVGGRIPTNRLTAGTRRAAAELLRQVRERLTMHRG